MQSIKIRAAIALVLGATTVFSLPALAADNTAAGTSDSAKTQSSDQFTDKQLKQFVKAQSNVQAVIKKWDGKVAQADDKKAAQKKENKAMIKAVKDSGLTPKQYNQIARQAQKSPKLTKRIQSFMTPEYPPPLASAVSQNRARRGRGFCCYGKSVAWSAKQAAMRIRQNA